MDKTLAYFFHSQFYISETMLHLFPNETLIPKNQLIKKIYIFIFWTH